MKFLKLIQTLLLSLFLTLPGSYAVAADGVAKVIIMKGSVSATNPDGSVTPLKKGMWVKEGAMLKTEPKSFIKLLFTDKSQMNLGPKSEMKIESFPKKKAGIISLMKGSLRSKVTKNYLNSDKDKKSKLFVKTKSAAMGVRGTDFVVTPNSLDVISGQVRAINKPLGSIDPGALDASLNSKQASSVGKGQTTSFDGNSSRPVVKAIPKARLEKLKKTDLPATTSKKSEKEEKKQKKKEEKVAKKEEKKKKKEEKKAEKKQNKVAKKEEKKAKKEEKKQEKKQEKVTKKEQKTQKKEEKKAEKKVANKPAEKKAAKKETKAAKAPEKKAEKKVEKKPERQAKQAPKENKKAPAKQADKPAPKAAPKPAAKAAASKPAAPAPKAAPKGPAPANTAAAPAKGPAPAPSNNAPAPAPVAGPANPAPAIGPAPTPAPMPAGDIGAAPSPMPAGDIGAAPPPMPAGDIGAAPPPMPAPDVTGAINPFQIGDTKMTDMGGSVMNTGGTTEIAPPAPEPVFREPAAVMPPPPPPVMGAAPVPEMNTPGVIDPVTTTDSTVKAPDPTMETTMPAGDDGMTSGTIEPAPVPEFDPYAVLNGTSDGGGDSGGTTTTASTDVTDTVSGTLTDISNDIQTQNDINSGVIPTGDELGISNAQICITVNGQSSCN